MSPDAGLLPSGGYPESAKLGPDAQRPGPLLPQFPQWLLQTLPRSLEPPPALPAASLCSQN